MLKLFPLRVILTVTTGLLLTKRVSSVDNGIGDLYSILEWMTGEAPYTHQLPRFAAECRPEIYRQHPKLDDPGIHQELEDARDAGGEEAIERLIVAFEVEHGAELPIAPLTSGVHVEKDPLVELCERIQ